MYKVFTEKGVIIFTDLSENIETALYKYEDKNQLNQLHAENFEELNSDQGTFLLSRSNHPEKLFNSFFKSHRIWQAAGGLVQNQKQEYLIIHRNGFWDLPKGKMEEGESIEETAVREVEEECGISNVEIKKKITTTYHTYKLKDGTAILKPSHWYSMKYEGHEELVPQLEEGITQVKWVNKDGLRSIQDQTFSSIKDVIEIYFRSITE